MSHHKKHTVPFINFIRTDNAYTWKCTFYLLNACLLNYTWKRFHYFHIFWLNTVLCTFYYRKYILSCLIRELGSPKQNGWRGLGRWWIPVEPSPVPGTEASGAVDWGTRPSSCGGMPEATSPNCHEVGSARSSR